MSALDRQAGEQNIDQLLAQDDAGGSPNGAAATTVDKLRNELETIAVQLKKPVEQEPFEAEPACVRAVELAAQVAQKPAQPEQVAPKPKLPKMVDVDPNELGHVGSYKLLKLLGQGGMGAVYKALHPKLDKVVALKVLRAGRIKGELVDRFQREMKALGKLDHPHLIRALDAGEADGTHYLVMEFVSGMDLSALLAARGKLPIADACELIVHAATGMHAAHSRGMIHRDIKPANLMLAEQEFGPPVVKVLDLGLALLSETHTPHEGGLTSDGQIMGTIDYMPPEQAKDSHTVDVRADIYSLGASLYALLTGGSIFQGRPHTTLMQKLMSLATEPIPPVQQRRTEISPPLAAIVHRMIARDPKERFASMAEVITALKPFTAGANLSALLNLHQHDAPASGSPNASSQSANDSRVRRTGQEPTITEVNSAANDAATQVLEDSRLAVSPLGQPKRSGPRRPQIVIAAAVAGVVLLGAILFSLRTPNGEVVVEIPDDLPAEVKKDIKINVTGDGAAEVASQANGWKIGIKEGKYSVELTGGSDRVQIEDKQVTVSRSKKAIVTITLKPVGTVAATPNKPEASKPADPTADRRVAEWVLGKKGKLIVRLGDKPQNVNRLEELPKEPFKVVGVLLAIGGNINAEAITNADLKRLAELPHLETLDLGRQPVTGEGFEVLSGLSELKSLSLYDGGVGVDGIPTVAKFQKLETFMFQGFHCDVWAEELVKLPMLREVIAYRADLSDVGVTHLARLPKLQTLRLDECGGTTDASLNTLAMCKSLRSLYLDNGSFTRAAVERLKKALPYCKFEGNFQSADPARQFAEWLKSFDPPMPFEVTLADGSIQSVPVQTPLPTAPFRVHLVFLQGPQFDQQSDVFLEDFTKRVKGQRITGVFLQSSTLTSDGMVRLTQLPEFSELRILGIDSKLVDDAVFKGLAALRKLQFVDLTCPQITGKGLGTLRRMTNLAMLNGKSLSVEGLAELQQVPLEVLQVDRFKFTERHVAVLTKVKLKSLGTNDVGIDDAMLARIAEMPTLEQLSLTKSPVTDAAIPELKKLKGLTILHLFGTKVTAAGVADLQQALPKCKIEWDAPKE